jgi:hypothetical protein
MSTVIAPACPLSLVDLLRWAGLLFEQAEFAAEAWEIQWWLRKCVSERTGISSKVIRQVIRQLAKGDGINGDDPRYIAEEYAWTPFDSIRVVEALQKLDKDGTTARLCGRLWEKWPVVRAVFNELFHDQGGFSAPSTAPTGQGERKKPRRAVFDELFHDQGGFSAPSTAPTGQGERKKPRRRGRKPDTDPKADKKVFDAWKTGCHKTYDGCAQALDLKSGRDVRLAIDRHRHRLKSGSRRNRRSTE